MMMVTQVDRVYVTWMEVGRHGVPGPRAAHLVPAGHSGDSEPAPHRPRQAPARTAPDPATSPGRVTTTRASASGRAGPSSATARSPAGREVVDYDDERVVGYLEWQSVAMGTTPRRYLVKDQWCRVQVQVRKLKNS